MNRIIPNNNNNNNNNNISITSTTAGGSGSNVASGASNNDQSSSFASINSGVNNISTQYNEAPFDPITLVSEDGEKLIIDKRCARQIGIIQGMLQLAPLACPLTFPVPMVKSTILRRIIEFLERHRDDPLMNNSNNNYYDGNTSKTTMMETKKSTLKSVDHVSKDDDSHIIHDYADVDDDDDDDNNDNNGDVYSWHRSNSFDDNNIDISSTNDELDEHDIEDDEEDSEYYCLEYLTSVSPWDQQFLSSMDLPTLVSLTKAANYLNIPLLLDLCCRSIAKEMTGLKAEELRKKFGLKNDFTEEEEVMMATEFAWIEE